MILDNLFWIGSLLLTGHFMGILSNFLGFPKISGYIFAGILLSPSCFSVIPDSFLKDSQIIIHFALAIIAFVIGGSLKYKKIKKLEKSIFSIMISASETTFVFIGIGIFFLLPYIASSLLENENWENILLIALFLGTIGIATAPAAVLSVISQYKAKGSLTTILLGIVATDDAIALINFSIVLSVAAMIKGINDTDLIFTIINPLLIILCSVLTGVFFGWLQAIYIKKFSDKNGILISTAGMLFVIYSLSKYFELDGLLSCMAFGFALSNLSDKSEQIFRTIQEHFEEMIFILFFIISGANVDIAILENVWQIAVAFVLLRACGKITGSWIGASLSHSESNIKKYIGIAQIPQAGVAVGLALVLYQNPNFYDIGNLVLNTVIVVTAVNEIIGPFLLKIALFKTGEARESK